SDRRTVNFHLEDDPIQAARFIPGSPYHYVGDNKKVFFDDGFDSSIDIHLNVTAQHSISLYDATTNYLAQSGVSESQFHSSDNFIVPAKSQVVVPYQAFALGGGKSFNFGAGNDTLTSSPADEFLVGGPGNDKYLFGSTFSSLWSSNGHDEIVDNEGSLDKI